MEGKIRVVIAKPGLDGHDRGAKVVAQALRDAGMEVIYTGIRQTPAAIVNTVIQEDAQVLGLSILSGAHNHLIPKVIEILTEHDIKDLCIVAGGVIPDEDIDGLKKAGVKEVFTPGTSMKEIIEFIREDVQAQLRE